MKNFRFRELWVLLFRILLPFVFFQISRFLFWVFNKDLIKIENPYQYLKLAYYGITFDTSAILYTNILFILLSLLPLTVNTTKGYQKFLFWVYFITNGIAYSMNFGDFTYYRFSQSRLTAGVLDVIENETNLMKIFVASLIEKPLLPVLFVILMALWIWLYKRVNVPNQKSQKNISYFLGSIVTLCIVATLFVGGVRGGFQSGTRPINMVDAGRHTDTPVQANIVLNSTFSFLRTLGNNDFKKVHFVEENFIEKHIEPYKLYHREIPNPRPNIVIFIVESLGKEYSGAFNKFNHIENFVSYTPFLDSLASKSLIFTDFYANGRQTIHAMSSILAGIPSFKTAFTGSPYANQKIQSIVSVCNELGYDTSFYHGGRNGTMGFQGFAKILGFQEHYGKDEYNNDDDFDGTWAIWDEPFLQYFAQNVQQKSPEKPFMATVFTASSHHPFKIPEKYDGKFKKGDIQMHEPIQYTDYALKKYFETAKKQPWFENTIFVITGDHTNQTFYSEYEKAMNRFALPLLLYSPNPKYHLTGVDQRLSQQLDIYPTLADLIAYNKPIRSWGKSLVSDKQETAIVANSDGIQERFIIDNYIYCFDGIDVVGIYDKSDLDLLQNLINQIDNDEVRHGKELSKAWYQDYMNRIMNRKLE